MKNEGANPPHRRLTRLGILHAIMHVTKSICPNFFSYRVSTLERCLVFLLSTYLHTRVGCVCTNCVRVCMRICIRRTVFESKSLGFKYRKPYDERDAKSRARYVDVLSTCMFVWKNGRFACVSPSVSLLDAEAKKKNTNGPIRRARLSFQGPVWRFCFFFLPLTDTRTESLATGRMPFNALLSVARDTRRDRIGRSTVELTYHRQLLLFFLFINLRNKRLSNVSLQTKKKKKRKKKETQKKSPVIKNLIAHLTRSNSKGRVQRRGRLSGGNSRARGVKSSARTRRRSPQDSRIRGLLRESSTCVRMRDLRVTQRRPIDEVQSPDSSNADAFFQDVERREVGKRDQFSDWRVEERIAIDIRLPSRDTSNSPFLPFAQFPSARILPSRSESRIAGRACSHF